ncbi:MAG: hypothetical protein UU73_C0002G0150 [Candidatus Daviesbacteria bacterium GW2011_GWA1_41_61]|uniref:Uncharacterized protein n=1 Tax=Candidatus Daviesbacteria bacterium GW2011_GWA2_40_9 TaxID=1618424 RepID=A0A0G0U2V0_9BACT|nr:MAG: hypothetical protein UU26_C0009G0052 [Candidatus Daviesbacteria bacterium GW2011_GWC1_40_9]KKR83428.1 MAG: hypothetical protein UU29_C0005G0009 [Candidatus Daviesbacteria bacterium GW2011_GWA2_40_9]KKR93810.1 MAG: hypothetical protein UU44_C0001G0150 [Candidatus Daviesbacteria bacterium GW2011_GWB1_41_15]KKS15276.1 MAG: hypothetical protein UU73_C0002G0150 [Candidatus Daviesbacteria bacterium GW2011_GWA1_41_61]
MERADLDQFFPKGEQFTNPSPAFWGLLRKVNFYSPVLVDTFLLDIDPDTVIARRGRFSRDDEYYTIGGKIMDRACGYMILLGDLSSELRLKLVAWKHWGNTSKGELGEVLFNDRPSNGGYKGRVTLSSNGRRLTGKERFGQLREAEIISGLSLEYYPERWNLLPIDPSNPQQFFDWWIISEFLPRFLKGRVNPLAHVPMKEMQGWVKVSDDPSEI